MTSSLSLDLRHTEVGGLRIAYREAGPAGPAGPAGGAGTGPAVLLVHGWPTSSVLWRDVMPHLAAANRVVAIDLPGYGGSAKPLDARYDATFYEEVLDGFLAALGIDRAALVVHDIGGPVGVHWALRNPGRLRGLGILNTLFYPEFADAVVEFVQNLMTPGVREKMVSPEGIADIIRLGVRDPSRIGPDLLAEFTAPFEAENAEEAREALARAAIGFSMRQFRELAKALPTITAPVRVIHGRHDPLLPDIEQTVERLRGDIPQAEVTMLDDCAHFIQLEAPDRVGSMLAEFLDSIDNGGDARTG